jgi:hypothetical protein
MLHIYLWDIHAFRHEFFVRIPWWFPLLNRLCISNNRPQPIPDLLASSCDHPQSYSLVEYPHLVSLDVTLCHNDYLEQFLNETKAYVPCLTKLTVRHCNLKIVTENFTREATRRNCARVKRLNFFTPSDNEGDHSHYFPLLWICSCFDFVH